MSTVLSVTVEDERLASLLQMSDACPTGCFLSLETLDEFAAANVLVMLLLALNGGVRIMIAVPSRVNPFKSSDSGGGVVRLLYSIMSVRANSALRSDAGLAPLRSGMRRR